MKKEKVITRKDETRFSTSDLLEAKNMFLAENAYRTWMQEYTNEDGIVVPMERKELIASKGQLVEGDLGSKLLFHMECGELSEIVVSNQKREAEEIKNTYMYPWIAKLKFDSKPKKYILYAENLQMAIDIVKDYAELNYNQAFSIEEVKGLGQYVLLQDNLQSTSENVDPDNPKDGFKFYDIEVSVDNGEFVSKGKFIVETKDIDKALIVIKDYVMAYQKSRNPEDFVDVELKLETAKIVSCNVLIDRDFSFAYSSDKK